MIPCLITEEHHEVFYIWHWAIQSHLIPPTKNLLLHVDEHADLGVPKLSVSLNKLGHSLEAIRDFIYQELNITNFIYPALYQGIFDRLYWLRQHHETPYVPRDLYISSDRQEGKNLKIESTPKLINWWNPDRKRITFCPLMPDARQINFRSSTVLDIDLDYFSCDNEAGAYIEIEITPEAYQKLCSDRYHKARLILGNMLTLKIEAGKYYICTDREDFLPESLKVSIPEIEQRIDQLIIFLRENQVKPSIITLCRSRLSGYTPTDQWEPIEAYLLHSLHALYPLAITTLPYDDYQYHQPLGQTTTPTGRK